MTIPRSRRIANIAGNDAMILACNANPDRANPCPCRKLNLIGAAWRIEHTGLDVGSHQTDPRPRSVCIMSALEAEVLGLRQQVIAPRPANPGAIAGCRQACSGLGLPAAGSPFIRSGEHVWVFQPIRSQPFESLAVLRRHELHREAFSKMAHHAADGTADGERGPYVRLRVGRDRRAGWRHVDYQAVEHATIWKNQSGVGCFRNDATDFSGVDDHVSLFAIEPDDLVGERFALGPRESKFEQESAFERFRDPSVELSKLAKVGNYALTDRACHRYIDHHLDRRNAGCPARKLTSIAERVVAVRKAVSASQLQIISRKRCAHDLRARCHNHSTGQRLIDACAENCSISDG